MISSWNECNKPTGMPDIPQELQSSILRAGDAVPHPEQPDDKAVPPQGYGPDEVVDDPPELPTTAHEMSQPESAAPFTGATAMAGAAEVPAGESLESTHEHAEPVEAVTEPADDTPSETPQSFSERHNTRSEVMDPDIVLPAVLTPQEHADLKQQLDEAKQALNQQLDVEQTPEQRAAERYETSFQGIRKVEIADHYNQVEEAIENEDAAVSVGQEGWSVNDSPLLYTRYSMDTTFRGTLPEGSSDMKEYIESELADVDEPSALEIGGTGRNLFGEFEPGYFRQTVSVNLTDTGKGKLPEQILEQRDAANHHTVIEGNATTDAVKDQVVATNNGEKYDVVFERLLGGAVTLPTEPYFIAEQAADYYSMVSDRGMMFMQVTPETAEFIEHWKDHVTRLYPGLEVQVAASGHESFKVVRIQKREGAPEHLPLFDARTIARWQRYSTLQGHPL